LDETAQFRQGSTIYFKGDRVTDTQYVVEWCQQVKEENAYLKVVGVDKNSIPSPYNDPQYPTFILVVLAYASFVNFSPNPFRLP
jgi:hypothetical protein